MNRSTIIASVVAVTGVLVAGSIAGVAVINAMSSTPADSTTVAVVATAPPPVAEDAVIKVVPPLTAPTTGADMPEIQVPTVEPVADANTAQAAAPSSSPKPNKPKPNRNQSNSAASSTPKPTASTQPTAAAAEVVAPAPEVSAGEARSAVESAAPGAVLAVTKTTHQGLDAWAVQIQRQDGSIVTGYVDRASGIVYDWTLDQKAPVVTQNNGGGGENEHEDGEHEDGEHEGGDDD